MDKLCSILEEAQTIADTAEFDFGIRDGGFDFNNLDSSLEPVSLQSVSAMAPTPAPTTPALPASIPPVLPSAPKQTPHKAGKPAKKRTWKKPKDKPKRPLSAYNLFFQHEREKIIASIPDDKSAVKVDDNLSDEAKRRRHRKTHGKIGFAALARSIAGKWKKIDDDSRTLFEARAQVEKKRYKKELDAWMKAKKAKGESTKAKKKPIKVTTSQAASEAQSKDGSVPTPPKSLSTLMSTGAELRKQMLQHMIAQQQQQQQQQQNCGMGGSSPSNGMGGSSMGQMSSADAMMSAAFNQQFMQQAMNFPMQMPTNNPMAGFNSLPTNPLQFNFGNAGAGGMNMGGGGMNMNMNMNMQQMMGMNGGNGGGMFGAAMQQQAPQGMMGMGGGMGFGMGGGSMGMGGVFDQTDNAWSSLDVLQQMQQSSTMDAMLGTATGAQEANGSLAAAVAALKDEVGPGPSALEDELSNFMNDFEVEI